jgi:hypothetical protein
VRTEPCGEDISYIYKQNRAGERTELTAFPKRHDESNEPYLSEDSNSVESFWLY